MRVLISGSSGLVGTALVESLIAKGHTVSRLVRSTPTEGQIFWDPEKSILDLEQIEGFDAVINLAGDTIMGRWSAKKKKSILQSRVKSTLLLSETLKLLKQPPQVYINASAIGYYGNRSEEVLTESSTPGEGFLSEVCQEWEEAAQIAQEKEIRVAMIRTGVVLSPKGGALSRMLIPFKLGLGGIVGNGKQYWSWISLDELVNIFQFVMTHPELKGPINAVSPDPITNREFTKTLGDVLHRITIFPLPAWVARLVLGEVADELLLASQRVKPEKLLSSNYPFQDRNLHTTLNRLLKG